jgi:bifunctional non-homologous end joining protein LigD
MDDQGYRGRTAVAKALLQFRELELATLADAVPAGREWVHEVKFDGYRTLTVIEDGKVTMYSRSGLDWTAKYAEIARRLKRLKVRNAIIDGEIVALNEHGASNFSKLKEELGAGRSENLQYYVFDLLVIDDQDITGKPLIERKSKLHEIITAQDFENHIIYSEHFSENPDFLPHLCRLDMEGIISKRIDSVYSGRRSKAWLKIKCHKRQEFVIVGFTESEHAARGFRSLLLGYYDDGILQFAGKVGTGFNQDSQFEIRKKLDALKVVPKPFKKLPPDVGRGIWVEPKLVCEVEFTEWTPENRLRHPSFQGLREDKPANAIGRDQATPVQVAEKQADAEVKTQAPTAMRRHPSAPLKPSKAGRVDVGGVSVSHPDRVIFPELDLTKLDLVRYYEAVAERILPHVGGRPLSLVRVPDNVDGQQFFQRHLPEHGGLSNVSAVTVPIKSRTEDYMMIEDALGLLSLAQWGGVEFHPWGCTADNPLLPDRMIFDLDPDPGAPWKNVIDGAAEVRERMTELGLQSFLKTTGGKGLHVVVPIERKFGWPAVKAFTRAIAESMAHDSPDRFIANMSKAKRQGRIFIDYLRNDLTSTAAAAFSVRARPSAGVSTPLDWKELKPSLQPSAFNLKTIMSRLNAQRSAPWADYFSVRQGLRADVLQALRIEAR